MSLSNISGQRCKIAAVRCRNASVFMTACSFTLFNQLGLWSESCSECTMDHCTFNGWSTIVGAPYPEYGVLFEGLGANTGGGLGNTRSGEAMVNGGLWRCSNNVVTQVDVGFGYNGIGGGTQSFTTCEGAQVITYELIKTTGLTAIGLRANASLACKVTDSIANIIQGFCSTAMHSEVIGSAANDINWQAESYIAYDPREIWFGATPWKAIRRPDGALVSVNNNVPDSGSWREGDTIFRRTITSGQPEFWRCKTTGTPGTWEAGPNHP